MKVQSRSVPGTWLIYKHVIYSKLVLFTCRFTVYRAFLFTLSVLCYILLYNSIYLRYGNNLGLLGKKFWGVQEKGYR